MKKHTFYPIAIVGVGGIFPDAPTLAQFWTNIKNGVSASREVPPGRWPLELDYIYDPARGVPDKVYSKRGCYIRDFAFDPEGLNLDPALVNELDPVFHFALHAARAALHDANLGTFNCSRTGVIIGNIALPTEKASAITAEILGRTFEEQVLASAASNEVSPQNTQQTHPINRYAVGMVAGMISKAFGLGGGSFTVDGACAASLYALNYAVRELQSGRADVMLTGGVCRPDSAFTQMGFSQLRALSPSGICAPFDEQGDGLVVGEGAGIFVLKRLDEALRDGNQIYAVVRGIGLSNDRQGTLLAPDAEGQVRAMKAAYQQADWTPQDVDLIECHATGTPVGDVVEFNSLRSLWGNEGWQPNQCVIGGVKSNVGHLLTGAGAAGLMKTVLALKNRTLPPMANFSQPDPKIDLQHSPFSILTQASPWTKRDKTTPRRAAVSAFGFGGINAHVLLEEWDTEAAEITLPAWAPAEKAEPVAIVGMNAYVGPWASLRAFQERVFGGGEAVEPESPKEWWGVEKSFWYQRFGLEHLPFKGFFVNSISIPIGKFRIPPRELQESLPQQLLMLEVAAGALEDAQLNLDDDATLRTGVFVGIGLDFNSTNFSYRWRILEKAKTWAKTLGLNLHGEKFLSWVNSLRDSFGPALTANRTVGALGGIVASRIAREFRIGGPSLTISAEESSGLQALGVAVRSLQQGDIDHAIVGAVDLNGDVRSVLTRHAQQSYTDDSFPGEGAATVVLKRLDDAVRDGNKIYAVIQGIGKASGQGNDILPSDSTAYQHALDRAYQDAETDPATIQYIETHEAEIPNTGDVELSSLKDFWNESAAKMIQRCALGNVAQTIGHTGVASGLLSLIKACLCLYQEIIPSTQTISSNLKEDDRFYFPGASQYWLRNRVDGPRRAGVSCTGVDGNCVHVVLEAYENIGEESTLTVTERRQPLGAREEALFVVEADEQSALLNKLETLQSSVARTPLSNIEAFARDRWQQNQTDAAKKLGLAVIARDKTELSEQLKNARQIIEHGTSTLPGNRVFYSPQPVGTSGEIAFVYPGSGNHYPGMGRTISALKPEILRKQDVQNQYLRGQYVPDLLWNTASPEEVNRYPREILLAQVAYSTMMTDVIRSYGIHPQAVIGYSLGESSAFFAMNTWPERDEMYHRVMNSPLYTRDLAGEFLAASKAWHPGDNTPTDWIIAAIQGPAEAIRPVLKGRKRVYLLIINTPGSCVIGGDRQAVMEALERIEFPSQVIPGISAAHCEVVKQVEQSYRALHHFTSTVAPDGIRFYNGAWQKSYKVTPDSAADAILAQALDTVDYPAVIQQAYSDSVRVFIEIGPGNSCANMIGKILEDVPHVAASACASNYEDASTVLRLLGKLISERVPVDLSPLYGHETKVAAHQPEQTSQQAKAVVIPTGGQAFQVQIPLSQSIFTAEGAESTKKAKTKNVAKATIAETTVKSEQTPIPKSPERKVGRVLPHQEPVMMQKPVTLQQDLKEDAVGGSGDVFQPGKQGTRDITELVQQAGSAQTSKTQAHEAYLRLSQGLTESYADQLSLQMSLVEMIQQTGAPVSIPTPVEHSLPVEEKNESSEEEIQPVIAEEAPRESEFQRLARKPLNPITPVFMTREQCMEFAIGSIATVLGEKFAEIDSHPTRVRLPDEPLMLVDRIISVEGEPGSMTHGRVITEHDIFPDDWYLDCGKIPTCIAVESGQADLFLSGYLGIDFITKGQAVYRLLDATVTFHRDLPSPGSVIRYDIRIDEFFRQGNTYLFRFNFDSTVDGELMLTMKNGCAGFFTRQELDEGKGLVFTKMDLQPLPGKVPDDWKPLTEMAVESYSDDQVDALRRGDLAACFGAQFEGLPLQNPCRLPDGRMKLVDRILEIDPTGGRYGLGQIRGEADIHPDDWFLTCHFSDDQVMPGTLMYECCLHTLRVFLMRMGWVGEQHEIAWEPVPGVAGQLKCRGQVIATTKKVVYEISLKEIGYRPEPYVICDSVMYADERPVVGMKDMSLRLSGMTREEVRKIWGNRTHPTPVSHPQYHRKPAIFDSGTIMAYSNGNPSEAFGDRYRIFDDKRVIARLPGPPYQFLDRITEVEGEQWMMTAGKMAEAQYDVPPNEWYFAANRCHDMPFSVLLEIVLQPCGWLAAYVGSALTSEVDLSFRNLGGKATQFLPVGTDIGTLTTVVKLTNVSASGGMVIQHYDYTLTNYAGQIIYQGNTYFGFFTKQALANQVGLREVQPYQPTAEENARGEAFDYPKDTPFPDTQLRMVDQVDLFVADGGPHGLGFIRGTKIVNPDEWFFKAHFYQDPVWPGSLGLEAFLQLLKVVAAKRWGWRPDDRFETMVLNHPHQWTYRGQVIPKDHQVTIQAVITSVDDSHRFLEAEGYLIVDGRIIYQMEHFTLRVR